LTLERENERVVGAREGGADVGGAEGDQLLVAVHPGALAGGQGGADAVALHVGHHRDHRGHRSDVHPQLPVEWRPGDGRQARRQLAHHGDTQLHVEVPGCHHHRRECRHHHGAGAADRMNASYHVCRAEPARLQSVDTDDLFLGQSMAQRFGRISPFEQTLRDALRCEIIVFP